MTFDSLFASLMETHEERMNFLDSEILKFGEINDQLKKTSEEIDVDLDEVDRMLDELLNSF